MASNLLQKEEEYRKLNEELQRHNEKLMEEYDSVMKKQDNLLKETAHNNVNFDFMKLMQRGEDIRYKFQSEIREASTFVPSQVKYFESATKENCENDRIQLDCIPESVDQMGIKGMAHFYRAKIKAMQNDYDKLKTEFKNKCEEIKKVQKENTKLMEDKDKWFQAYNTNKINIGKMENQITTINSKCHARENENASLKKEIEQLKKDLKSIHLNVSASEIKLNRALEENEKIKTALKAAKQEEKEIKESHRKDIAEITTLVKRLEKQKIEVLNGFKKQLQLIDNLKRQKACLETAKLAQISENEFMRILDWKMDD